MTTFGELNGKPDPEAKDEEIRHLLWRLDPDDPDGLEPPSETDETGVVDIGARSRRIALDDALDSPARTGIYDRSYPYRTLYKKYTVEELRFYVKGPTRPGQ